MKKTSQLVAIKFLITAFVFFIAFRPGAASDSFGKMPILKGEFEEYTIKKGEDLYDVARKYELAIEHVMFANGLTGINAKPGTKLIIPTRRIPPSTSVENGLVLNLPERGIYLYKDGEIKKFFPVAIGAPGKWMTPIGDFKIITKVKNPTWLPPEWAKEENPVAPGPSNPLGDRWMGLNKPGYGIHATNSPISIGLATSHGCIRMYPGSAQELFNEVSIDMPVKIVYEPVKLGYDPFEKRIYMEVYPDVYGKTPGLLKVAREKLKEYNLLELVNEKDLEKIVRKKKGIPVPVLGTDIVVKVDDVKQDLYFSPISHEGRIWVTSEVLKPIGAVLAWDNSRKQVDIFRGKKKISLKVRDVNGANTGGEEVVAYLWRGRTIIPLSYVLKGLDVNYFWLPENRTILIYSGEVKTKAPEIEKPEPSPSPSLTPPGPLPDVVPDDIPPEQPETSPGLE